MGVVAQEQRQWAQEEGYYQQALAIFGEYDDRYEQASTYRRLGRVAEEQQQWAQAKDYFLRALEIFTTYTDAHSGGIVQRSLARLWQASGDATLPAAVAALLGSTPDAVEAAFQNMSTNNTEE